MLFMDFISRHRKFFIGVGIVVAVPGLMLAGLALATLPDDKAQKRQVAAIALEDHYSSNPPYGVWDFEGVRITEDDRVVVDVHVAIAPHATFIKTRNKRIRYSYLKLACPKADADVHKFLQNQTVWINLNFHGETLLLGACPKPGGTSYFSS